MLNTNYSYVNPLINQHTDNLAKGVPHQTVNRNFSQPIEENKNLSPYNRENSDIAKKLYSPKLAPSTVSTESYLKSRSNKGPIFMHNEAMTRYYFISQMQLSSSMQKNAVDFMI
tara:strand:+ start:265 stop:606 length:342 start_codon:yes stop_codon:yes gene_type:complete